MKYQILFFSFITFFALNIPCSDDKLDKEFNKYFPENKQVSEYSKMVFEEYQNLIKQDSEKPEKDDKPKPQPIVWPKPPKNPKIDPLKSQLELQSLDLEVFRIYNEKFRILYESNREQLENLLKQEFIDKNRYKLGLEKYSKGIEIYKNNFKSYREYLQKDSTDQGKRNR